MSPRAARIWALIGPSLLVALVTLNAKDRMIYAAGQILLALWITTLGALLILATDAKRTHHTLWERVDILTSSGAAMMVTGSGALLLSTGIGWASLSIIGVLGVAAVSLAVICNALVASSDIPCDHHTHDHSRARRRG